MVRYRRMRRRVVRRPVRSRRFARRRLRYRRGFRKNKSGNIHVKITKVVTVTPVIDRTSQYPLKFQPLDFPEFMNLAPNFEAYAARRMLVRVIPQSNVGTRSYENMTPGYCMYPWHGPNPSSENFNQFMSIDKCKYYSHYQRGRQIYNLNTLASLYDADGKQMSVETQWGKRIEITSDEAYKIIHYGGCIGFQSNPDAKPETSKIYFNVILDVWVTFYNQKTLKATRDPDTPPMSLTAVSSRGMVQ
ncbi:capsid protein [Chifec virus UA13_1800]|uniref:Capsid protein n=1 Tax=Chifec virus UA13_1800 TaxID=2914455 RepID=A0AAX3A7N0_9CIRC|nr:capsid protein [Chifec virus UA13_1800]UNY50607.1 capsid protein [Chifec virus UA13_1800]